MARKPTTETSTATIGFEAKLWLAADKLRNNMDAAEYKHVVLGLIFLKYISDTFEEHRLGELIDLAPQGRVGFVLANGSMSSNQSGEGDIRRALIEADLVDCVVALPGQLFYSMQIPVCLWFSGKMDPTGKCRAVSELELALAA